MDETLSLASSLPESDRLSVVSTESSVLTPSPVLAPAPAPDVPPQVVPLASVSAELVAASVEGDAVPPPSSSSPPWWVFVLFGVVVLSIAVAVFAYGTRCPCEPKQVHFVEPDDEPSAKPFEQRPIADLKSTLFVLSWQGDAAPTKALKVHFLLKAEPHSTFSCNAYDIFGSHGRVRVTLPKGEYVVRIVFGDGTQSVCDSVPSGGLVTLTEVALRCQKLTEHVAAADVPVGACLKDQ